MIYANNPDFYPTPENVVHTMIAGFDIENKNILEPSAGKGNIVDVLEKYNPSQILTFEKEPDLAKILRYKSQYCGNDFLQATKLDASHIDFIIMNPPFSNAVKHILHAWNIAPEGCTILSLINTTTIKENDYTSNVRQLKRLIDDYGDSSTELGNCFTTAERKTNVEVTLVKLFKPIVTAGFNFDQFLDTEQEEQNDVPGVMTYNDIQAIVSQYVYAVKNFASMIESAKQIQETASNLGLSGEIAWSDYNEKFNNVQTFANALQKSSWKKVFSITNAREYVTTGVMNDLNKFIETQSNYPFTVKNVYRMLQMLLQSRGQIMERALVEAFDTITKHYKDNRYSLEGWKTNSHYLINRKFILPYMATNSWNGAGLQIHYSGNADKIDDLHKALCYLTGTKNITGSFLESTKLIYGNLKRNTWYKWGFLRFKVFKKGSGHFEFIDHSVWEQFNRKVSEIKGYPLPEKI